MFSGYDPSSWQENLLRIIYSYAISEMNQSLHFVIFVNQIFAQILHQKPPVQMQDKRKITRCWNCPITEGQRQVQVATLLGNPTNFQ